MTTSIYYVDADRVATDWGTAVDDDVATENIYKLTIDSTKPSSEDLRLKYAEGDAVSAADVEAAEDETTVGAVPAVATKRAFFGSPTANDGFKQVAAVSGAVTVNAKYANVIELALTGNVSSLAITNPGRKGRLIELHFKQDSTGSRTLSGVSSAIKLAAGALTLTTTASKRDVIRLRHLGAGAFVEVGRTLNL